MTLWDLLQRPRIQSDIRLLRWLEVMVVFCDLTLGAGGHCDRAGVAESRSPERCLQAAAVFPFQRVEVGFSPAVHPCLRHQPFRRRWRSDLSRGSFLTMVILTTSAAVESIRADHISDERSFGATKIAEIVRRIYLPSMLPLLIEALRISMIFTFTGVILAEMYAARVRDRLSNLELGRDLSGAPVARGRDGNIMAIMFNEVRWVEKQCGHWRT